MMENKSKAYIALFLTCIIWGTTYLVNKLGVSRIPPIYFSAIRQFIAGSLILLYCFAINKIKIPEWNYLKFQLQLGFILITIGNGVGVIGLSYIDSGLAAILAAISPIVIAVSGYYIYPNERLTPLGWIGIVLGFAGVYVICFSKVKFSEFNSSLNLGIALTLISVICWGIGSLYSKTKKFSQPSFLSAGFQMLFGSIPMIAASSYLGYFETVSFDYQSILLLIYVLLLGSIVAYSCYIYALQNLPVIIAGIQSYINPILAIVLGAIILNESLSISMITGSAMVLIGVFLINYSEYRK